MNTPIYDDTLEVQLNALICQLDENSHICTNPVEESSYLGFTLADTQKGFLEYIKENLYDKFLAYLESYKNDCVNSYAIKTHFIPIIKRLLVQYNEAVDSLYNSETRNGWSDYFNESVNPDAEQNLTKHAYQFFYNASSVQIFFLGKLVDKLKEYLAELETSVNVPEPEYYFSIQPEFSKSRHNILYDIHKNLKAEGYIDCTPDAFKNVFTNKEPKPIRWFKPQRSLTYMIKMITGRFLVEKSRPSNFYIAERYFHIYKNGVLFRPKKLRHDDDPKKKDKEFLDHVIDNAIRSYM